MSTMTLGYPAATKASCSGLCAQLWSLLGIWQQRARQRRQLADLGDRLLGDIGISRQQAEREAAKPFWQA